MSIKAYVDIILPRAEEPDGNGGCQGSGGVVKDVSPVQDLLLILSLATDSCEFPALLGFITSSWPFGRYSPVRFVNSSACFFLATVQSNSKWWRMPGVFVMKDLLQSLQMRSWILPISRPMVLGG